MAQLNKRYGKALFDLAIEKNKTDEYFEMVGDLLAAFSSNTEILDVLNHPQIAVREKIAILENTFSSCMAEDILGLMVLLIRKNHETEIVNVLSEFLQIIREYKRITTAFVSSAIELTPVQISDISTKLSDKLKKQVEIEPVVDPSLVGGLRILVDGFVFDNSIKRQFSDLKRQLLNSEGV